MPPIPLALITSNDAPSPIPLPTTITTNAAPSPLIISKDSRTPALNPRIYEGSTVPQGYGNSPSGPDPGAVVGIVLGSVAGFLLIWGVIRWSINLGQKRVIEEGSVVMEVGAAGAGPGPGTVETSSSVLSWHSRPRRHRRHSGSGGGRRKREKYEIRRERVAPVPMPMMRETVDRDEIIVEEFGSRPPSRVRSRPPPPRDLPRTPPHAVGDDEIVVLEEETPPQGRRRDSIRSRSRMSAERRSVYRDDVYIRTVSPPRD
jgi:hypothetical protein